MRRLEDFDFGKLRLPPGTGLPAPNQGGVVPKQGPKNQIVTPNRAGVKVGRPALPDWREAAGGPRIQQKKDVGKPNQTNTISSGRNMPSGMTPLKPRGKGGPPLVGAPKPPEQPPAQPPGQPPAQPRQPAQKPREPVGGGYTGGRGGVQVPQVGQAPGQTPGQLSGQLPGKPGETPGEPQGVLRGQMGPSGKQEYTVTRPMNHQELQTSPAGIINTPNATLEKGPDGKISVRGLTPQGEVRLQRMYEEDRKKFKGWSSDLDPNAPEPPIRPGGRSFNPLTGEWINDENSILSQLGGD